MSADREGPAAARAATAAAAARWVTRRLLAGAFLRAAATGMVGVLLGLHLARLGFSEQPIGIVTSLGLAGSALAAALATFRGDRLGRGRLLVAITLLSAVGLAAFALSSTLALLCAAAFVGMVNGAGRDRGAALILEQSLLVERTGALGRTQLLARYNVAQDAGHAIGGLLAGLPELLRSVSGEAAALRGSLLLPALLLAAAGLVVLGLRRKLDRTHAPPIEKLSPQSRPIVARIAALFALDSFAGGFLTTALVSYWFFRRFGVEEGELGLLTAAARVLNAFSHLAAARLARRFGLVNTMVFTHLPSSLLLVAAAVAPSFPIAASLFLLREGLVEMDVPTRQSYVLAVVAPQERTRVAGVTALVRMAGWAVAPAIGGLAMRHVGLAAPLFAGAALKIAYDLMLFRSFRRVRPPEERAR